MPWAMLALKVAAVLLVILYVGMAAILYFSQRSMMYFPETVHTTPTEAGFPGAEEVTLTCGRRRAPRCVVRGAAPRAAGRALFPRQWRRAALPGRAVSQSRPRRHRLSRPRISRLRRLDRESERDRTDRRWRGGLCLCCRALSGEPDRCLGRVARHRRCRRARGREAGRAASFSKRRSHRRRRLPACVTGICPFGF